MELEQQAEQQKIIRVVATVDNSGADIFIDRVFNKEQTDQQNCDTAVQQILAGMHDGTVIPALRVVGKAEPHSTHIMLNLGNILYMTIVDVRVYAVGKPKE